MKKIILSLAAVLAFGTANAQYKAMSGDVTIEFGLTGGINNTNNSLPTMNGNQIFKARYFKSDKMAFRGILGLAAGSSTDKTVTNVETKNSNTSIDLGIGIEKHFTGTDRLATYVGGDFLLGFGSTKETVTTTVGSTSSAVETKGPGSFGVGARGVFGADYYFAKKVYLGVEAGLQLMFKSTGKTTVTSAGVTTETEGGSEFNINPSMVAGLKLGYSF